MVNNLEKKLKEVIVSCGDNIEIDTISDRTNLVDDLNFSSINIIMLVVQLEETFDIEIEDENLSFEKLSRFKNLKELVNEKIDGNKL